jgi:ketosteroid isomerase-like protein
VLNCSRRNVQLRTPSRAPSRGQRSASQPIVTRIGLPYAVPEVDETDEIREGLQAITLGQRSLYSQTTDLRSRLENIEDKLVNVEVGAKRTQSIARGRSTARRDKIAATQQLLRDSSVPVRTLHAEESGGEKEFLAMDSKTLSENGKKARAALLVSHVSSTAHTSLC